MTYVRGGGVCLYIHTHNFTISTRDDVKIGNNPKSILSEIAKTSTGTQICLLVVFIDPMCTGK